MLFSQVALQGILPPEYLATTAFANISIEMLNAVVATKSPF
jgi:hypothetical protein